MRTDALDKASGAAKFAADVALPGMLYGKLVRSPLPHARVVGFDTAEASRVDGVKAIVTGRDVPHTLWGHIIKDQAVLAWDKVRFVGEAVAAVAATTLEAAEDAARLIRVEYEALPAVFSPLEATRPGAPILHERLAEYEGVPGERAGNRLFSSAIRRGDVERAFAAAALVVEDEFEGHIAHPAQLEPHASLARVADDGTLEIWTSTQVPFAVRKQVAEVLGLPLPRVRVIATHVGGGFGNKLVMCLEPICALLSLRAGAPVRIVMTREEEFETTITRHAIRTSLRTAVDGAGTMVARHARLLLDKGAYADHGPGNVSLATLQAVGPYRIEHLDVEAATVYTNKISAGAYRGPTGPQVTFAVESHVDHIAARLGVDPVDFRLQNAVREDDLSPTGQRLRAVGLRETLERVRVASGWDAHRRQRDGGADGRADVGAVKRGLGIACGWWLTGGGPTTVRLRIKADGTVYVGSGMEIGTGSFTAGVVGIVADRLGVDAGQVEIALPDTAVTPYDPGSFGSRTLFTSGSAASLACDKLLGVLREAAARHLGVRPDDVEIGQGGASNRVGGGSVSLALLAKEAEEVGDTLAAEATFFVEPEPPSGSTLVSHLHHAWLAPSFFTAAAEVEVDTATGRVRATRLIHAQDAGRVLNAVGVAGQIRGGVTQALGYALTEELIVEDGVVRNPSLLDYRMPTPVDVPPIEHIVVQTVSTDGPLGTKGVGEPPVVATAAAIANAFCDATGVRPQRLPLTPENVFWMLDAAASARGDDARPARLETRR